MPLGGVQRRDVTAPRVLLVDDNDDMLARAGEALTPACVVAGKARNGKAALEAAEALQPDVIVLDISMPDMTGFEVAAHLRQTSSAAAIVFLRFTRATSTCWLRGLPAQSVMSSNHGWRPTCCQQCTTHKCDAGSTP